MAAIPTLASTDGQYNKNTPKVLTSSIQKQKRLVADLERMLKYSSTMKDIVMGDETLNMAVSIIQDANTALSKEEILSTETGTKLLSLINELSAKIYPATPASLEIAELMEPGDGEVDERQKFIRRHVRGLVSIWIWTTSLFLVVDVCLGILTLKGIVTVEDSIFVNGTDIALGFLGSCAYILRGILQKLENKTFVLRDGTGYTLRAILGGVLGFVVPGLILTTQNPASLGRTAIAFLAGYAVEPMFAALDNLVLTIKDLVSKTDRADPPRAK